MARRDGTRVVHAGLPAAVQGEPLLPGPEFSSLYHLPGEPAGGYEYGRYGNRTWAGARAQSALMSVLHTAKLRGTDSMDFLSRLLRAPAHQQPLLITP